MARTKKREKPSSPVDCALPVDQHASVSHGKIVETCGVRGSTQDAVWAVDEGYLWEVRARAVRHVGWLVQAYEGGVVKWRHLAPSVDKLAVSGGFAAFSTDSELHVLSLESGRLLFPPMLLDQSVVQLGLNPKGHLVALTADTSVIVWDLPSRCRKARGSLAGVCAVSDVRSVHVKVATVEPMVHLCDDRLLLWSNTSLGWSVLAGSEGAAEMQFRGSDSGRESVVGRRLEVDLVASLCVQDPMGFRAILERMAPLYAEHDVLRMRAWCHVLGVVMVNANHAPSLTAEFSASGFDGPALVREIIVGALSICGDGIPAAASLLSELEGSLQRKYDAPAVFPGARALLTDREVRARHY